MKKGKNILKFILCAFLIGSVFILSSCDSKPTNEKTSEISEVVNSEITFLEKNNIEIQEDMQQVDDILKVLPNVLDIELDISEEMNEKVKEEIRVNLEDAYTKVYSNKVGEINDLLDSDLFIISSKDGFSTLNYNGKADIYNCLYFFEGITGPLTLTEEDIKICLYNMFLAYSSYDNSSYDMYADAVDILNLNNYNIYESIIGQKVVDLNKTNELQLGTRTVDEYNMNCLKIKALPDTGRIVETEVKVKLNKEESLWVLLKKLGYDKSIIRAERTEDTGRVYVDLFEYGQTLADFEYIDIMWQHPDGYMVYINILEDGNIKIKETLYYYDDLLPLFNPY